MLHTDAGPDNVSNSLLKNVTKKLINYLISFSFVAVVIVVLKISVNVERTQAKLELYIRKLRQHCLGK